MNVSLTPELQKMVEGKVSSGLYNNASEVIREALRLLKEQDDLKRARIEEMRQKIQVGIDDVTAGRVVEGSPALFEEIKSQGRKKRA